MKYITLFGPTIVMGKVRHAHENPLTVSNREASRLRTAGVLAGDPQDAAGDDPPVATVDETEKAENSEANAGS